MDKNSHTFDDWFGVINANVLDRVGVDFKDEDSVRGDYDSGRDVYDVIDEICAEYQD
jgi:hypothetical protein